MKYKADVIINAPIRKVIDLMEDVDNLKNWQPGLESFVTISGERGMVGSKSKMSYDNKGKKMELIETITVKDFKDDLSGVNEFSAIYEAPGVWNLVQNYFSKVDEKTTRYAMDCEFKFNSLPMKIMGFLMPGLFKKTTYDLLGNFKKLAESK